MYNKLKIVTPAVLVAILLICVPVLAEDAEEQPVSETKAELLSYARIYTGGDKETHFDDVSITFTYRDYGKNIPTVWLSEGGIMNVAGLHFVSMPAGWDGREWHPAPARQFIIPLAGEMEFETSDGEKRVFGPGDILLVEDTAGKGHISRMVSTGNGVFAVIPLPE
jgi:hypothetical protein